MGGVRGPWGCFPPPRGSACEKRAAGPSAWERPVHDTVPRVQAHEGLVGQTLGCRAPRAALAAREFSPASEPALLSSR